MTDFFKGTERKYFTHVPGLTGKHTSTYYIRMKFQVWESKMPRIVLKADNTADPCLINKRPKKQELPYLTW